MEKRIIEMMEIAMGLTVEEMESTLEDAKRGELPFRYLMKEVFQNEVNRRNGKRHLPLDKVKKIYEEKQLS